MERLEYMNRLHVINKSSVRRGSICNEMFGISRGKKHSCKDVSIYVDIESNPFVYIIVVELG